MMRIPNLKRLLRLPGARETIGRDVDDEVAFHLEMRARDLVDGGATPRGASRIARREFGDVEQARRVLREASMQREQERRRGEWLGEVRQDVRYALRQLVRNPGFTVVAALTIALGIGANTAIFSVVHGILLRPLPFGDPDGVVRVASFSSTRQRATGVSVPDFLDWRAGATTFSGLAAYTEETANLTGNGDAERVNATYVTADFFTVLRVRAVAGRMFLSGDDATGAPRSVVLSYGSWQRRFGADPAVVGRSITLNSRGYTVVGVAPPRVDLPAGTDVWLPYAFTPEDRAPNNRGARFLRVVGRLRASATIEQARTEMTTIAKRLEQLDPKHNTGYTVDLLPMHDALVGNVRRPLFVLLGAVGFVLLIACANVANLMLVRGSARETELAVRTALGAGRGRLVRQLMTESVALALVGGVAGCGLAVLGMKAFVMLAPSDIPLVGEVRLDGTVLAFTLVLSLITGVVFGLAPAMHAASMGGLAQRLREGGRGARVGPAGRRARDLLTVAELALAVMLLAGAGLLIRSFARLRDVDPGFRPAGLAAFTVTLPYAAYPGAPQQRAAAAALVERIRRMPGVQSAAVGMGLPLSNTGFSLSFTVPEHPPVLPQDEPSTQVRLAGPRYFATLGIPVLRGRAIDEQDRAGATPVLVINETFAKRHFPNEDPLGKHLRFGLTRDGVHLGGEIIGVVGDTKQSTLGQEVLPEIHAAYDQWPLDGFTIVMRTSAPPAALGAQVRAQVRQLDPNLPIFDFTTLGQLVDDAVATPRFYMTLLGIFAGVALALATIGTYGVIAYGVAQRTHEIGVRMALGASGGSVVGMVVRQGFVLAVTGTALGVVGALSLTRVLASLLFEVQATDPLTFVGVGVVLIGAASMACVIPARRAARVDPLVALRSD